MERRKVDRDIRTAQHKTADGRNETGQKRIEWKRSDQTAIHELCDAGKDDVEQICVDHFQFLWCIIDVFVVEFGEHRF